MRIGHRGNGTRLPATPLRPHLDDIDAAGAVAVRHEEQVPRIEPRRADIQVLARRHPPRFTSVGIHDPDGRRVHVGALEPHAIPVDVGDQLPVR